MSPCIAGVRDRIDYTFFDRACLNCFKTTLFQEPIGMGGKRASETNMQMGGQLPAPQMFDMTRIRAALFTGDRDNLSLLPLADPHWPRISYNVIIGRKLYQGGALLSIADPIQLLLEKQSVVAVEAVKKCRPEWEFPLHVECGEWMGVEILLDRPVPDLWVDIYLDGKLDRAVQ
jgi:hypothetical protein